MFDELTFQPAVALAPHLIDITPEPMESVLPADSGSVPAAVTMRTGLHERQGSPRDDAQRLMALRGAFHSDTS